MLGKSPCASRSNGSKLGEGQIPELEEAWIQVLMREHFPGSLKTVNRLVKLIIMTAAKQPEVQIVNLIYLMQFTCYFFDEVYLIFCVLQVQYGGVLNLLIGSKLLNQLVVVDRYLNPKTLHLLLEKANSLSCWLLNPRSQIEMLTFNVSAFFC